MKKQIQANFKGTCLGIQTQRVVQCTHFNTCGGTFKGMHSLHLT